MDSLQAIRTEMSDKLEKLQGKSDTQSATSGVTSQLAPHASIGQLLRRSPYKRDYGRYGRADLSADD